MYKRQCLLSDFDSRVKSVYVLKPRWQGHYVPSDEIRLRDVLYIRHESRPKQVLVKQLSGLYGHTYTYINSPRYRYEVSTSHTCFYRGHWYRLHYTYRMYPSRHQRQQSFLKRNVSLVRYALLLTPACWKSDNTNARLTAFAPSLALDPTFGIHSHKTLDTAQPFHF